MRDKAMSLIGHLEDLRRAFFISLISLIPATTLGWVLRHALVALLTRPVQTMHFSMVYITPAEAFLAQMKLALAAGVVFASPVILWQFWGFILPALKDKERHTLAWFVPVTVLFFAGGIVFAFYTVFPVGVQFLLSFGGDNLRPMLSIGKYLSFSAAVLLPFGIIFEMPPAVYILSRMGVVSGHFLSRNRKNALLAIVVAAAALTPGTDVVSQLLMAGPMYALYEISIAVAYLTQRKASPAPAGESAGTPDAFWKETANQKTQAAGHLNKARTAPPDPDPLTLEETLEQIKRRGDPGSSNKPGEDGDKNS